MSKVSPVFKALLSPHFREGAQLQALGAIEVPLPEDDAYLMLNVCRIADHQSDRVKIARNPSSILSMSAVCDKYGLHCVLRPWIECWVREILEEHVPDARELDKLLAATYHSRHAKMFRLVGKHVLAESTEHSRIRRKRGDTWTLDLGSHTQNVLGVHTPKWSVVVDLD